MLLPALDACASSEKTPDPLISLRRLYVPDREFARPKSAQELFP